MYCKQCGHKLNEGARFCTNCGNIIGVTQPVLTSDSEAPILEAENLSATPIPPKEKEIDPKKVRRQRIITFVIIFVGIILGSIYYFFIRHDPGRDAKKAALGYCECLTKYDIRLKDECSKFLTKFDSFQFASRQEARTQLQNVVNNADLVRSNCQNEIGIINAGLQNRYLANAELNLEFNNIYSNYVKNCNSNTGRLPPEYSLIEQKILTIVDPEPDIEKIKNDLIGQSIPGWKFEYLNEFISAEILNTTRGENRVEYQCKFDLAGSRSDKHECEVLITYSDDDSGWNFTEVRMDYITYTNQAVQNEWRRVQPLPGCSYQILNGGNRFWVQDGVYGTKYKGGGDDSELYHLTSSEIYIASREAFPVDLIFKYTLQN